MCVVAHLAWYEDGDVKRIVVMGEVIRVLALIKACH
jgi:hypothetical protein